MVEQPADPGGGRHAGGVGRRRPLRRVIERGMVASLVACGVLSVLITFSIVGVLFQQTAGFFGLHGEDTPGAANDDASPRPDAVRLNEIRTRTPGEANPAYVELIGPPGARLDGLKLAVVAAAPRPDRGPANSGVVRAAAPLDGLQLDRRGFALIGAPATFLGVRVDREAAELRIEEPVALTYLLLRDADVLVGDDLDPDDAGRLEPVGDVVDAVALGVEGADPERFGRPYAPPIAGEPAPIVYGLERPEHVFRLGPDAAWRLGVEPPIYVTLTEFLTGREWNPLLGAERHFGIWPLVSGTLLVTGVAMCVAIPGGLLTAIFLSEYSPRRLRAVLKPILEILAGIPTVVYGFFALTAITPVLRDGSEAVVELLFRWFAAPGEPLRLGPWVLMEDPGPLFGVYNAFSAGLAVGVMCLPIVTSLSEDALQAVPKSLREGAYGLGATRFDVSVRVVTPAALSGVVAAFLLAIARSVGETMIVALAAGGIARLTLNPTSESQTMTAYMVQIFLGDVSNFGSEYLSAYAVGAALFVMTLILTLIGGRVLKKFREEYE